MNLELLEKLSNGMGVSGNEEEIRKIVESEVKKYGDEITIDALGNLIIFKKGKNKKPKVMFAAHMDEIGLMITFIEKSGYLRFEVSGGIDPRVLPAKHIIIGKEKIPGVIGFKSPHLSWEDKEFEKVVKTKELYIDIGATSDEEAKKFVKIGDYAMFATKFEKISDDTIKGKAFDDRLGCYVLIELLKEKYDFPIYGVFTVQEEVGLRGARAAGYRIEPDVAFAIEGTAAGDFPQKKDLSCAPEMGKGPVITIVDKVMISDRELVNLLVKTAEEENLPYQFKQPNIGGTDAGRIQLAKSGCKAIAVAVPSRYIHSPVGLAKISDIENTIKLLKATLKFYSAKNKTGRIKKR